MTQVNVSMNQKQTSQTQRTDLIAKREGVGGGMNWEVGVSRGKLLHTDKHQSTTVCIHTHICVCAC